MDVKVLLSTIQRCDARIERMEEYKITEQITAYCPKGKEL